jgi:hypothetical protein
MIETIPVPPLNRKAVIGILAAILALLAFCSGLLPLPLTAMICYPPGILLGIISLISGLMALSEIRKDGKRGRRFALIAAWAGGLMITATI